ncbi:MAG: serine/threonine protein kinase [Sandaracinus sp.]|nr:serine/threonine protein kinase [Sandaracinus sp.]MCB9612922.1 serine/threonine protein kinase [Sandaracinus sp.]MCB9631828.1 serine/threonine protein kinase [Sandaracinus sp.]
MMDDQAQPRGIGRFLLREKLGHGGNGEVWSAEHPDYGAVALKLVCPLPGMEVSEAHLVDRLEREAELASRVDHPNVLRVIEHGVAPTGEAYLATELLEGQDLGEVVAREGRRSPESAVAIVDALLAALEAVHAAGIVHRDLKPDNVFLHVSGAPERTGLKLIDFGIARGEAGRKLTRTGTVVGTPHYLAPEQAMGREVDARTDLYAVGVILHELLTGRTPFEGLGLSELALALVSRDVEPVTRLRPELRPPMVAFIHRVLDRDPDRRPQTATEMRAELARVAASTGALGGTLEGLVTHRRQLTRVSEITPIVRPDRITPPSRPPRPRPPQPDPAPDRPRDARAVPMTRNQTAPIPLVRPRPPRLFSVRAPAVRDEGWSGRLGFAVVGVLLAALTFGFSKPDHVVRAPRVDHAVAPLCTEAGPQCAPR